MLAKSKYFRYNLTSKKMFRRIKMANLATTKMSSKGQVVIPEDIRKRLNLKAGSQFIVVGEKDVVIFKSISQPSMREFDKLIAEARKQAKEAGLKRSDVYEAIAKARGRK
jgi:AbrB family looped-hinge helix DNA binding protein